MEHLGKIQTLPNVAKQSDIIDLVKFATRIRDATNSGDLKFIGGLKSIICDVFYYVTIQAIATRMFHLDPDSADVDYVSDITRKFTGVNATPTKVEWVLCVSKLAYKYNYSGAYDLLVHVNIAYKSVCVKYLIRLKYEREEYEQIAHTYEKLIGIVRSMLGKHDIELIADSFERIGKPFTEPEPTILRLAVKKGKVAVKRKAEVDPIVDEPEMKKLKSS